MSQFYQAVTAGSLPPSVPIQFTTSDGTIAIPVSNNLNILSGDTSVNNDAGIQTIVSPNGSANLYIQITNRVTGSITTTDSSFHTIITFPLGSTPGVYKAEGDITAFNITSSAGASYAYSAAARTDGISGVELGSEDKSIFEEASMTACDFRASVVANNVILEVKGTGTDTIHWSAVFIYRFVS